MLVSLSSRGKEKKFNIIPKNINEGAHIYNIFPEANICMDGSVNVSISNKTTTILSVEDNVRYSTAAMVEVSRIERLIKEKELLKEELPKLKEKIIEPTKNGVKLPLSQEILAIPQLFSHQIACLNFMLETKEIRKTHALFLEQGTGKTAISIIWAEHLIETGEAKRALVVAPLMTLENSWMADIKKWSYLKGDIMWTTKSGKAGDKIRQNILDGNSDFVLINPDGLRIHKNLLTTQRFDIMIIDESSCIKNRDTKVFQAACQVGALTPFKMILNGTPAPNSPLDLWSQFFWLDDGITLDSSFNEFRSEFMFPIEQFWRPKTGTARKLNQAIEPFNINFRKSEVFDLPERISILKRFEMIGSQKEFYDNLEKNQFAEYEGKVVALQQLLPKFNKLRQVTGGFFFPNDESIPIDFPINAKMQCLKELVLEIAADSENQGIIWAHFRHEIEMITKELEKLKIEAVSIYGGTDRKVAMENLKNFTESRRIKFLVGNPASIGVGTNIQNSNYSIYYSVNENLQHHLQSLDRNHRSGQTRKVTVYYLVAKNTYDERLVRALRKKEDFQSVVVSGFSINKLRAPDIEETWDINA